MRKVQRLISGVLCFSMLFLMVCTAFAAATPYYAVRPCTECVNGSVRLHQRTEVEKDEFPHFDHMDIHQSYYEVQYESCDSCSYRKDLSEREIYAVIDCPWDH